VGKDLRSLRKDLPEGKVVTQEGWVESKVVPGTDVYIKGKYDLLVERPDKSFILIDLKISQPDGNKIDKYKTQLGAYKFALENPKYGKSFNITKLGLLIFYPDKVSFDEDEAILHFPPKWLEVPIDEKGFISFTKEVDKLLSGKTPDESRSCRWCQYRHLGETLSHLSEGPVQEDIPF
jgi:hypothetical protein